MSHINESKQNHYDAFSPKLKEHINKLNTKIKSLAHFKELLLNSKNQGVFDSEDIGWVDKDISHLIKERDQFQDEYNRREDLYENNIIKLESILTKRKKIIETAQNKYNIFKECPELLQLFAKKRAQLIKTIDQTKKELQNFSTNQVKLNK